MKLRYFLKKHKFNPKRSYIFMILFLSLVSLTVGYAFLTQSMAIEGVSQIVGATWDIHFENIQIKSGSVTPTEEATITNPTTITFGVQLDNPGDFYEFNVDVVNAGTFNAMIESVMVLPVLTPEQLEYLEYTIMYINEVELAPFQRLDAGNQETLTIRFYYKEGVEVDSYPFEDQEIEVSIEIIYIQADGNETDIGCVHVTCETGTYLPADSCECVPCEAGSSCAGGTYNYDPIEIQGRSNCPAGSYSLSESEECTQCPAGTYQDEVGQTGCKVCANGKTSSAGSTASCTTNCSNSSGVSNWITPTWTGTSVSNSCKAASCEAGNHVSGNTCAACAKGTYAASANSSTSCTQCPAGTYQDEVGQTGCKVCANGKTSSAGSTASCTTNCSNSSGVSSWTTPTWTGSSVNNSCKAVSCNAGNYINGNNCTACAKGTYYPTINSNTSCTTCPAGSYQDATGQTGCKVCANGKTSSAGATASCTTNCSNSSGASTWVTPTWTGSSVSNSCKIATCTSGYNLTNDNACRKPYTVTFNYNKAAWNTNTTRSCTPGSNGKCSVTAPGISNISGSNKNGQAFSNYLSIKGWNTNSGATTATYGSTASIEVSGNTTLYAIVTLAKTSFWMNADALRVRTGIGTSYTSTGQIMGRSVHAQYNEPYYITVGNFGYLAGDSTNPLWLYITAMDSNYGCNSGGGVTCPSTGCVCLNRWGSAYYLIYP